MSLTPSRGKISRSNTDSFCVGALRSCKGESLGRFVFSVAKAALFYIMTPAIARSITESSIVSPLGTEQEHLSNFDKMGGLAIVDMKPELSYFEETGFL